GKQPGIGLEPQPLAAVAHHPDRHRATDAQVEGPFIGSVILRHCHRGLHPAAGIDIDQRNCPAPMTAMSTLTTTLTAMPVGLETCMDRETILTFAHVLASRGGQHGMSCRGTMDAGAARLPSSPAASPA